MIRPELILYRISTDESNAISDVPERLRRYLDACAECHDGDLHSPLSLNDSPYRVEAAYECENNHRWTRGYSNP